jgi:5-methyltetrahydropteroyltriglutamate--homocysteine methyltransferase
MKRSTDRIRTTHTGSMPRPPEMLEMMRAREGGQKIDEKAFEDKLTKHVAEIVRRQVECGIDVVNDGECGKPAFLAYQAERLGGLEARIPPGGLPVPTGPLVMGGRDATQFRDFYEQVLKHNPFADAIRIAPRAVVGPLKYVGQEKIQRDIRNLKAAMAAHKVEEGFLPAIAPFPLALKNEHYKTDEEYREAYAEAMREEYKAILDAGLLLQIDYPQLVSQWDERTKATLPEYRKWMEGQVELLNHVLRGLPEDRIRFHTCYGVNFGPRVSDLQLENVIDVFYKIKAGSYSFEAANPRHEHEWSVPKKFKVPDGKVLIPGIVTHSNVMIEHPEVVAERIERWANAAGKENVLVGNDCGFASVAGNTEIQMTVAWAKLASLGEGARIASKRLWS